MFILVSPARCLTKCEPADHKTEINSRPQTLISPYFTRTSSQIQPSSSFPDPSSYTFSSSHKQKITTSGLSSPLSPARSLDSSFLGDHDEQEASHKSGGERKESGLKTPPPRVRGQRKGGLLTPSASPEDGRGPRRFLDDDEKEDCIVGKRRKGAASLFGSSDPSEFGILQSPVYPDTRATSSQRISTAWETSKNVHPEEEDADTSTNIACTSHCLLTSPSSLSLNNEEELLSISCDLCETLYHTICLGLPETEEEAERVLPELFYCERCRPGWCRGLTRRLRRGREGHAEGVYVFVEVDGKDDGGEVVGLQGGGMDSDGDEEDDDSEDDHDTSRIHPTNFNVDNAITKLRSTTQVKTAPVLPTLLPEPTVDPLKTYVQQYEHFFSLFAGSSDRGRDEMEVLARRDERLVRQAGRMRG